MTYTGLRRTANTYRRYLREQVRAIEQDLRRLIREQDMYTFNEYRSEYRRLRRQWMQLKRRLLNLDI